MRVLWLTNLLMPDLAVALNKSPSPRGGWMPALAEALIESSHIKLAVATVVKERNHSKKILKNIRYYVLPKPKGKLDGKRIPLSLIKEYQHVVNDFRPDVIHIHGTEYFQGLLTGRDFLKCPTVISIQGIIDASERHYLGGIPINKLLTTRTLRDWIRFDGLIEQKFKWARRAKWEREIFASNPAFIGRTLWDRAQTRRLNPVARYHHCDELLRQPFYDVQWNINKISRHTIFASGANYPLKGFHVLVKAASLLRIEFPDITIRTPLATFYPGLFGIKRVWRNQRSMGYARYLTDLIRNAGMTEHFVSLPSLDADGMANQLLSAHVFVLPSMIENSPNSLGESMLVGTPSVASFVGGIPSMAQDGESVLLFPSGDEVVLAEQIRRIFLDDELACRLSAKSVDVARARHSRNKIVNDMLEIYERESMLQAC